MQHTHMQAAWPQLHGAPKQHPQLQQVCAGQLLLYQSEFLDLQACQ
jgi:hypothetical protein